MSMLFGDQRPHLRPLVEAVAEADLRHAPLEGGDEALMDRLLDQNAGPGRADLAGVEEDAVEHVVEGGVEVGVGEDDVGVLPPQLQGDLLDVAAGGANDLLAGIDTAGKGDQVDVVVLGQLGADAGARSEHRVDHPPGEAGLFGQFGHLEGGQRGELARLHDDGTAGRQRRGHLPGRLQQGIVPGGDLPADADRLAHDAAAGFGLGRIDRLAALLVGQPGVVAEDPGDVVHVPAALLHRLAGIEALEPRQLLAIALDQRRQAVEQRAAPHCRGGGPFARVKGGARRGDGGAGILAGTLRDLGDHRAVGRVDDLPDGTRTRLDPFAVDKHLFRHCFHFFSASLR